MLPPTKPTLTKSQRTAIEKVALYFATIERTPQAVAAVMRQPSVAR